MGVARNLTRFQYKCLWSKVKPNGILIDLGANGSLRNRLRCLQHQRHCFDIVSMDHERILPPQEQMGMEKEAVLFICGKNKLSRSLRYLSRKRFPLIARGR